MALYLVSDRTVTIDGLCVLEKDVPREITLAEAASFELYRGLPFHEDQLPEFVKVVQPKAVKGGDK